MRPIDLGRDGIVKVSCYGDRENPVKPADEVWLAVTPDEISDITEGLELLEQARHAQVSALRNDVRDKGVAEESARNQIEFVESRAERVTAVLQTFMPLVDNETVIARLSREVR